MSDQYSGQWSTPGQSSPGPQGAGPDGPTPYGQPAPQHHPYAQPYAPGPYGQGPSAANPYGQHQPPTGPATAVAVSAGYAHWGRRVGAYLVDSIPNLVGSAVFYVGYIQMIIASTRSGRPGLDFSVGAVPMAIGGVIMLLALGWTIYNRWIIAGRTGQSLGKRVTKITLLSGQTGQPIGPLNAFVRDLVHILDSFAYVGYLWPLWDARRQTFADKILDTVVVRSTSA